MGSEVISHIYWSTNYFYANGTQLKIRPHLSVDFQNELMSSGKPIITWGSAYNYQGTKTVPQLPILQVNHQYRIMVHIKSVPDQTYLVRIIFKNLQGVEIKREEFRSPENNFTVPEETTSYSVSIINTGLISMHFDRIDIMPSSIASDALDNIWIHKIIDSQKSSIPNLILVQDSKQARRIYSNLTSILPDLPTYLINISWQFSDDLTKLLSTWLKKYNLTCCHLISTDTSLDQSVLSIGKKFPGTETMVTSQCPVNEQADAQWQFVPGSWYSPNLTEPDWESISLAIKQAWEGVK